MKTMIVWLAVAAACFMFAACTTAEVGAGVGAVAAIGMGAQAFVDAMQPLLSPEQFAELQAGAAQFDGTANAMHGAVTSIVDSVVAIKQAWQQNVQVVSEQLAAVNAEVAGRATPEQVALYSTGSAATATGASRYLSARKHGFAGKAQTT